MKKETEKIMYSTLRYNQEMLDYVDFIIPKGINKSKREIAFNQLRLINYIMKI